MLHREVPASTKRTASDHKTDYRKGIRYARRVPVSYQPRKGGPPLLFATDVRMTILVHLALAPGPVRPSWLWRHLKKGSPTTLKDLVARGLVSRWRLGPKAFIALDPCHPAARSLCELLRFVGHTYKFRPIAVDVDAREGGDAPVRPSRRRDVRNTFGDRQRTMPLLLLHVLNEAAAIDIARCVPYLDASTIRHVLYMYRAFGVLQSRYAVHHKRRTIAFSFNEENPLVPYVRSVLAMLDKEMPQWRFAAVRQRIAPLPPSWKRHHEQRKRKRWKWGRKG